MRSLAPLKDTATSIASPALVEVLSRVRSANGRTCAITGAGVSTQSGIPDYRSPGRPEYKPLNHIQFMTVPDVRSRYWARSALGFWRLAGASPNAAHASLAGLELGGFISGVVTQNVDRLHQRAGSLNVIELHGSVHDVECLACGSWRGARSDVQSTIESRNAAWLARWQDAMAARPDGDMELPQQAIATFSQPECPCCGAAHLKPCVVFHGGSVEPAIAAAASDTVLNSRCVLVLGTTLSTWSSFRLVKAASQRGASIVVINFGKMTRGDDLPGVIRIEGHTSSVMRALAGQLLTPTPLV